MAKYGDPIEIDVAGCQFGCRIRIGQCSPMLMSASESSLSTTSVLVPGSCVLCGTVPPRWSVGRTVFILELNSPSELVPPKKRSFKSEFRRVLPIGYPRLGSPFPQAGLPMRCAPTRWRSSLGPRTWQRSRFTHGQFARMTLTIPTSCGLTSTRSRERVSRMRFRIAGLAHELLDELGFRGFPKTSGGRGLHIYLRVEPRWDFIDMRHAAIAFGRELERRAPDMVTTNWWKEERGEKIFVDYNQNARDRTIASAYSVRPRPGAPVSAPIEWSELPDIAPLDFTVKTMPERFARLGDLHHEIDDVAYDLAPLLEMYERDERDRGLGEMPYPPDYPKMAGNHCVFSPVGRLRNDVGECA